MSSSTSPNLNPATNQTPLANQNLSSLHHQNYSSSSTSTPTRSSQKKPRASRPAKSNHDGEFTSLMQDAQARGKDPYREGRGKERAREESDDEIEMDLYGDERFNAFGFDNYERTQQRRGAAMILDNPELIMMHSLARGDSIPATRHYFMKMMCGYLDPNEVYQKPGMAQDNDELRAGKTPRSASKKSRKSGGFDG